MSKRITSRRERNASEYGDPVDARQISRIAYTRMQIYVQATMVFLHHGLREIVRTVNAMSTASLNQAVRFAP